MLSKKHYNRIAAIIAATYESQPTSKERIAVQEVALDLSEYFKEDNDSFDTKKFWRACFGDK